MMAERRMLDLEPWTLPLIVAAIIVPVVVGFLLAGPVLGLAVGIAMAALVFVIAARMSPGGPIETAAATDAQRHVLVVLSRELDDPAAIEAIKREGKLDQTDGAANVRVLAPAQSSVLDRWATDVTQARSEAQRKLVVSVASLGKADVPAEAAVGDPGIVQAVEDQLRSFPATEVILVTGEPDSDQAGERAATELGQRLEQPLSRIVLDRAAGATRI